MKFHIGTLLSFLSGLVFFSAPAVSMRDEAPRTMLSTVKRKSELPKSERVALKKSLRFSDTVSTYSSLRPVNGASDAELIQYIVTQLLHHQEEWNKLIPSQKEWFFSSVQNRALKNAVAHPDPDLVTYSAIRKSGNTASPEELISFLMEKSWKTLASPQKQWLIAKAMLTDHLAGIKTTSSVTREIPPSALEDKATRRVIISTIADDIEAAKSGNPSLMLERIEQTDKQIKAYTTSGNKRLVEAYSTQKKKLEAVLERLDPKHPRHFSLEILAKGLEKGRAVIENLEKGFSAPGRTDAEGVKEEKKADSLLGRTQQYERTVPEYFRLSLAPTIKLAQKDGDGRPVRVILKAIFNDNGQGDAWNTLGEEGQEYLVAQISEKPIEMSPEKGKEEVKVEKSKRPPALLAVPQDQREKERVVIPYEGKTYQAYNVSTINLNCGLNTLDVVREDAVRLLTPLKGTLTKKLNGELEHLSTSAIDNAILPYIGRNILGANIRVFLGGIEFAEMFPDEEAEPIYRALYNPDWPTINILNDGMGHFQILVPTEKNEESNLLREYARQKENLKIAGEEREKGAAHLDGPAYEREYAAISASQFLNGGKGGWLKSYLDWLRSRK